MASSDGKPNFRVAGRASDNAAIADITISTTETEGNVVDDITFNATWSAGQANEIDQNVATLAGRINRILAALRANGIIIS